MQAFSSLGESSYPFTLSFLLSCIHLVCAVPLLLDRAPADPHSRGREEGCASFDLCLTAPSSPLLPVRHIRPTAGLLLLSISKVAATSLHASDSCSASARRDSLLSRPQRRRSRVEGGRDASVVATSPGSVVGNLTPKSPSLLLQSFPL